MMSVALLKATPWSRYTVPWKLEAFIPKAEEMHLYSSGHPGETLKRISVRSKFMPM